MKKTSISKLKTNIVATTEILYIRFITIIITCIIICLSKQYGQFYESLSSEFQAIFHFLFFPPLKLGCRERAKKMWLVRQAKPQELFQTKHFF